ncbi:metallophosphoesterase [Granulicella cerasi]|uniref:metallophosphoesterase n=1 Tax=Granulicella cerasi TaxID=741063 RepID=UPI0021DF9268|nr:metallophosphoesterase [Granulicella cerasi]
MGIESTPRETLTTTRPQDRIHLAPAPSGRAPSYTRRAFLTTAGLAAAGLATYSNTLARHELVHSKITLPIRNLPDAFVGFRMVQISDLHLHGFTESWFLEQVIGQVNAMDPEVVLITGDFVSRGGSQRKITQAAGECAEILSQLKAPQRFGILGNHDVAVGANRVIEPLEAHRTPVLVDSFFALERGSDLLWLAGADDASIRLPDLDMSIPLYPKAPVILLAHEPDFVDHVVKHPRFPLIDAMLSGHTHGGQIRLPGVGPLVLPPLGKHYVQGAFQFEHMKLYVNRGVGTVGVPFRFNCPAEITEITLQRA